MVRVFWMVSYSLLSVAQGKKELPAVVAESVMNLVIEQCASNEWRGEVNGNDFSIAEDYR